MAFVPGALLAQSTTGAIEGTLRAGDGFRTVIHSNASGEFAVTLPYGHYWLSGDVQHGVAPSGAGPARRGVSRV